MKKPGKAHCSMGLVFLAPSFAGVLLFVLIPFADVIRRSFITAVTEQFSGMENYRLIFNNKAFLLAVKNTIMFTAVCIPLLVIMGLLVALALSRIKQVQLVKSLYLFPLAMPTATVVLVWKLVFYPQGFLNKALTFFSELTGGGQVRTDYLGTGAAFSVLVVSYLWKNLGYTVILWLAGIFSISTAVLEAAKVDGAGAVKRLVYVMLPQLKGSLYTIVILSFLNSFKIYREAYLVAGAYPEEQGIYLLQHLFNNWFVNLELDKMAAAAVVTGCVLFALILLLQNMWDRERNYT